MKYLNFSALDQALNSNGFKNAQPFPFIQIENTLTESGYQRLTSNLPDLALFEKTVGEYRMAGQKSHDRYALEYEKINPNVLPKPWLEFIAEIQSKEYRKYIKNLYGVSDFKMRLHWHFAFHGCSVSPHCDAKKKLGSHIFYLNTDKDWKKDWGGGTLILKPKNGRTLNALTAPDFSEFDTVACSGPLGNKSMFFERTDNSWHGVNELNCPADQDGYLRKVFIVVLNRYSLKEEVKQNVKSNYWFIRDKFKSLFD